MQLAFHWPEVIGFGCFHPENRRKIDPENPADPVKKI
jgi:hypothetical protein